MTQQRQRHLESRASEVGLKHFEMTLVEFNESLRDGETEPSVRRLPIGAAVDLAKPVEDRVALLGLDARPDARRRPSSRPAVGCSP